VTKYGTPHFRRLSTSKQQPLIHTDTVFGTIDSDNVWDTAS
jgi:hypothetical protein